MRLGDALVGVVYDIVYAVEVIDRFENIVNACIFGCYAKGVSLEDKSCLLFGQTATFDVVGVVGKVYLCAMVDAPFEARCFLLAQA